jgi:hypothetical protein
VIASDILAAMRPVVEALERLGVRYHVGGSVASSALGVARSTLDVDLVADLRQDHVDDLVSALELGYYIDGDMIRDAIRRRSCFNVIHLATMLKVDLFVLKQRPYDRLAFSRAAPAVLEEEEGARSYLLASAEDTILNKLEWYEMGGRVSDRQWGDVLGVLRVRGDALDLDYLRRWAEELGIRELFERALAETDPATSGES